MKNVANVIEHNNENCKILHQQMFSDSLSDKTDTVSTYEGILNILKEAFKLIDFANVLKLKH